MRNTNDNQARDQEDKHWENLAQDTLCAVGEIAKDCNRLRQYLCHIGKLKQMWGTDTFEAYTNTRALALCPTCYSRRL